jgi:hypothetical protein
MRFYKGDIVEILQGDNIGNRYRIMGVVTNWHGILYNLPIVGLHTKENIMLYHRPFANHLKDLRVRFISLFAKTQLKRR